MVKVTYQGHPVWQADLQRDQVLRPRRTCKFYLLRKKNVFADMIKLRILNRLSWIIRKALNTITVSLYDIGRGRFDTVTEKKVM